MQDDSILSPIRVQWQVDLNTSGSQMVITEGSCSESDKSWRGHGGNSALVSADSGEVLCDIVAERRQSKCHCITFCIQASLLCGIVAERCAQSINRQWRGAGVNTATDIAFPSWIRSVTNPGIFGRERGRGGVGGLSLLLLTPSVVGATEVGRQAIVWRQGDRLMSRV